MELETKRTNKERSILDAVFALAARKADITLAGIMVQKIIASLILTRWLAAFGKN